MRFPRLLLAAVVLGTVAASGAGAAVQAAPGAPCGGRISHAGRSWLTLRPPFGAGSQSVTQVVAPAFAPDRLYVTNGTEVLRSDDDGCSWKAAVEPKGGSLGVLPAPLDGILRIPTTTHITSIAAPSSATASDRLYVAWDDSSAVTVRPHVSYFDGTSWHQSTGLPRFGSISELAAVDDLPTSVYAVVDPVTAVSQDGGLFASGNGGVSFTQRNASVRSSELTDLQADPIVNTLVYGLDRDGMQISHDGGANFSPGTRPGGDITSYDVATGNGSVRMVQGHASAMQFDRSNDGGLSWQSVPSPVAAKEVALQPLVDQVAVSDGRSLWLEPSGAVKLAHEVTPAGGAPTQLQFSAPVAKGFSLVGLRGGAVLRATFNLKGVVLPAVSLTPIRLLPQVLPRQFPSTMTPGTSRVALPPGGHQDVNYHLLLPRTPSPVDVMFLVDTTDSMQPTIDGLRQDLQRIVNDLSTVGLDVEFGVAEFKDYPPTSADIGDGEPGDKPYLLHRTIGRSDSSLAAALSSLRASGGGDLPEADLTALYQSTTGTGQHVRGMKKPLIPPGQQARYRTDALRLAVLATDAPFHREPSYLTPRWSTTVGVLRANHVHPIGLAVQTVDEQGRSQGFRSFANESQLGQDTGTFAPRGGVDCNGDLTVDIPAGAPFVCKVPLQQRSTSVGGITVRSTTEPVRLAPAISTAAESLPDLRTVGLQFTGHAGIASLVAPRLLPQVNLKNDNTVNFTVRYSCPKLHQAHVYDLGVNAGDGNRVLATSSAQVACGAVAAPPAHVVPPAVVVGTVVAPAAVGPAPPPAPGNPLPNPNPNPNPAVNANVGMVGQEEEQRQLAFAGADAGVEADTSNELAMARLGGGAALLLAGAAGYAARRRFAAAWHRR